MANTYIKIYKASYVTKEFWIQITYCYTPIIMARIQNLHATEDVEQKELSCLASGNGKWHTHFERLFGIFSQS